MSGKDSVKRGAVAQLLCDAYDDGELDEGQLAYLISEVNKLPAVPHEMNAREYIREYRRMHSFYFGKPATDGGVNGCGDCPCRLNGMKDCIFSPTRNESSIPLVEKWVQEHPEERSEE